MSKQETPEEKLLKLIRKKKNPETSSLQASKDLQRNLASELSGASKKVKFEFQFLKNLNRLLMVVTFCLFGVAFAKLYTLVNQEQATPLEMNVVQRKSQTRKKIIFKERPQHRRIADIEKYNIFQLPWEKAERKLPVVTSSSLNKELKLLGIVLDDDPKAIIQNMKTKETLFLSEGEEFNGATVEKINEETVWFLYNGERVEIIK